MGFIADDLNTSRLIAMMANALRGKNDPPRGPAEFMLTRPEPEVDEEPDPLAAFDEVAMRAGVPVHDPTES
jgi:hypothetical protein